MVEKQAPGVDYTPAEDGRVALQAAVERPDGRREIQMTLTVSGGLPAERYELLFEFRGTGDVSCRLVTSGKRDRVARERAQLADDEAADLVRRMRLPELIKADVPMPRIPPDSLVGRLQLSTGGEPLTIYFMADPGQARDAGQPPPPQLVTATEAVYDICERLLGDRWKAP